MMGERRSCEESIIPRWAAAELEVEAEWVAAELRGVPNQISEFGSRYRGKINGLRAADLALACQECERFISPLQMATVHAEARVAVNVEDHGAAALLRTCERLWQLAAEELADFEREITELPRAAAEQLLSSPEIDEYANYIRKILSAARHHPGTQVSEALPRLDSTGNWEALARQLLARIVVQDGDSRVSLGSALPVLYDPDERRRASMCAAISDALAGEVELRATVLVMLTRARQARDKVCGADGWLDIINADNQVAEDEVEALTDVVRANVDIVHRYYQAKAEAAGRELTDADRYAPIDASVPSITWPDACDIVLTAFSRLGEKFYNVARELLDSGAVDALPRPGKRQGSVTFGMPGGRSLVLVNFTGRSRDALTLAHELAHAVHGRLAATHGVLTAAVPEIMAETIALFTETLTAATYAESISDPAWRRGFAARWAEDQMTAIFRQVTLHDFEARMNRAVMDGEEPRSDTLGEIWLEQQRTLYGPAVRLQYGYRQWWSYLDSFFFAPGSRYAYAYGQLAAAGLFAEYQDSPAIFRRRYLGLLQAGGTRRPVELLGSVGLRIAGSGGWLLGMGAVRQNAGSVFSPPADTVLPSRSVG